VFPIEFWGCPHNLEQVLSRIESLVNLRRQEKFPRKVLMNGINVSKIKWLFAGGKKKKK